MTSQRDPIPHLPSFLEVPNGFGQRLQIPRWDQIGVLTVGEDLSDGQRASGDEWDASSADIENFNGDDLIGFLVVPKIPRARSHERIMSPSFSAGTQSVKVTLPNPFSRASSCIPVLN